MDNPVKILLIEDNPGDAFLIKFYLEETGGLNHQYFHAEQLSEGLQMLRDEKCDVILLDLNLPDSNGISTVQNVLKESGNAVVIVLTGITDEELGIETVKLGAQDFLVKGQFDGKVLNSSIRYAVERFHIDRTISNARRNCENAHEVCDMLEDLVECGTWTYTPSNKAFSLSRKACTLFGIDEDSIDLAFSEFIKLLTQVDANKLSGAIADAVNANSGFVITLGTSNGKSVMAVEARYSERSTRLIGTIRSE